MGKPKGVNEVRYSWLSLMLLALAVTVVPAQTNPSLTLPLPRPHRWDPKATQICTPLGNVGIGQGHESAGPSQHLVVEAASGGETLELTWVEKEVLLRVGGHETEQYKVVADTAGYVNAVFTGWIEPTLGSIMIDKVTSYVVWSRTEPADPSRDVPHHVTVFLACSSKK
jgi:hypothetical protein